MKISKKIKIGAARYRVKYEKGSFASIDPKEARKEGKCFIGEHVCSGVKDSSYCDARL